MPKQKSQVTDKEIEAITIKISQWPIENKVSLFQVLKSDITQEAEKKKEMGDRAAQILKGLNGG